MVDQQIPWSGMRYVRSYALTSGYICVHTNVTDSPAAFYSFSFAQNHKWSSLYPPGPEIVKYLEGVCEKYEIVDKIQLNSEVTSCRWNESEGVWELTIHELVKGVGDLSTYDRVTMLKNEGESSVFVRSEKIRAKILISAVGGLVEPNRMPETIPGIEDFQGAIFHSARWRYDVDLKDKNILVVGTGCSAAQFVPELTKTYGAKAVTQLMRSPPWVVPRQTPPFGFGEESWEKWSPWLNTYIPGFARLRRLYIATRAEYDWRLFGDSTYADSERAKVEVALVNHMKNKVPKKYHEVSVLYSYSSLATTDF
jgi:cation diffusion facilitator CzcD-associated flavoprotein CzcO